MQTHGGTAAEQAILSQERSFRASVMVDWNNNGLYDHALSNLDGYVVEVSVDRALKGSAPEEILLIEGSGSAELIVQIEGSYLGASLTSVFSPFNSASPFAGMQTVNREIKYSILLDTPLGTFEYKKFIGNIRTITPDRGSNSVEITALDRAEKMRKPIQLPPWAVSEEHMSYGEYDSQYCRSQWVIDHAARLCGASPSPKRPATREELGLAADSLDGPQFWVSGNGSYLPTIGFLDNPNADTFPNPGTAMFTQAGPVHPSAPAGTPRPLGLAGLGTPIQQRYGTPGDQGVIRYWAADQDRVNAAAVHYLGFTLNTNGPRANDFQTTAVIPVMEIFLGTGRAIVVAVRNGKVFTERWNFSSGALVVEGLSAEVTIPTGQQNVDIFVMWDCTVTSGSKVFVRAGTNTNGGWVTAGSPVTSGAELGADQIKGRITIGQGLNLSDVFYATRNDGGRPVDDTSQVWRPAEYVSLLDQGINQFSYMPSAQRQEAWSLVQNVAAAEYGSVFWDEEGRFRFWNWDTMLAKRDTIVRTLSLDDVSGLQVTNTLDSVRNIYSVTTSRKRAPGVAEVFRSSDVNEFFVAAQSTVRFRMWIDGIVSPLTFRLGRFGTAGYSVLTPYTDTLAHGFVAQYFFDGAWQEHDGQPDPEVFVYFTTDGYLTVRIKNDSVYDLRMAAGRPTDSPTPVFRFSGTKLIDSPDMSIIHQNRDSVIRYGPRTLDLSGDWYQDASEASTFFQTLLFRTAEPVPTTDAITIAGDPRLQLGDVFTVTDTGGLGDMKLQILGIRSVLGKDTGLTDTLTVEMVPPPGPPPQVDPPGEPPPMTPSRFNLCPNPACAVDTSGYYDGAARVSVTGMSRPTGINVTGARVLTPRIDVKPGEKYIMSAQIKGNGGSSTGIAYIDWYSRRGYMSSTPLTNWSVSNGGVTRVYTPQGTVPTGAVQALMVIREIDNPIIVSAVLYEKSTATQGTYFDGDSTNGRWDGAAGKSSSRLFT